jgi:hypothetical protein
MVVNVIETYKELFSMFLKTGKKATKEGN